MKNNTLLIETTLGSTFLGRDSTVPVRINNRVYISKKVSELKPGDMVLYEKEYIRKMLGEIEPYLMESPRYAHAKDVLFERNSQGRYIPRLRCNLWRPFYTDAESRILLENDDFIPEDYDALLDVIYKAIGGPDSAPVARSTVMNWLRGDTISPESKDVYMRLAEINPVFMDWYRSFHPEGQFVHFYDVYVRVNQGVMRYLAARKGQHSPQREHQPAEVSISLAPEIRGVLKYVIDEVNDQFSVARVTEIKKAGSSGRSSGHEKFEPHLVQGIYHKTEPPTPEVKIKSLRDLRSDQVAIEGLLLKCIRRYMASKPAKVERAYPMLMQDIDNIVLHGLTEFNFYLELLRHSKDSDLDVAKSVSQEFSNDLKTGLAEQLLELPLGTLRETGDVLRTINQNMPYQVFECARLLKLVRFAACGFITLNPGRLRHINARLKEAGRRLRKDYSFEEVHSAMYDELYVGDGSQTKMIDLSDAEGFITRQSINSTLDDYGIEPLSKFNDGLSLLEYERRLSGIVDTGVIHRVLEYSLKPPDW